jgi:hypothetical protein
LIPHLSARGSPRSHLTRTRLWRLVLGAVLASAGAPCARAQRVPRDSTPARAPAPMNMDGAMPMRGSPLGISMDRMGSGTSWIPEATPLPAWRRAAGAWDLMFQGIAFGQFDDQGGPRGGRQFGSLSRGMFMATHDLGAGQLQLRSMLSLDALGVTGFGYPLLLQSGEEYQGQLLHDRQHPHDAFMEVGALYQRSISRSVGLALYAAPVGEPALGPVAYVMRPSAMDNPVAPIGHHWQDATHISFGVLTTGLFTRRWKLEGSWFNGREPDDQRWNFDPITLDSWSGRLAFSPNVHWSASASYGFLASPDASAPSVSEHRATLSVLHGTAFGRDGQWSTTLTWGGNLLAGVPAFSNSVLLESEAVLDDRNTVLARAERVQKSAAELALTGAPFGFQPDTRFNVSELSAGYVRELAHVGGGTLGLGALATLNLVPSILRTAYGSTSPMGAMVFLRIRPRRDSQRAAMHR